MDISMKIDFEVQTKYGVFRDAIHTPVELTEEQIESIKTERVNNWIAVIDAIHSGAYDKYIVTDAVEGEDLG
jgi:hypothetical protein